MMVVLSGAGVAITVVVPAPLARTNPVVSIDATFVSLTVHRMFCGLVTVAHAGTDTESRTVSPARKLRVLGVSTNRSTGSVRLAH